MELMQLSINTDATGRHIQSLLADKGYTVKEVQEIVGLGSPQAVYKWYSGRSLPNIDNLLVLSKLLNTNINELLVTDEEPVHVYPDLIRLILSPHLALTVPYTAFRQTNQVFRHICSHHTERSDTRSNKNSLRQVIAVNG